MESSRLVPAGRNVIHETFDDEVVIIHLERGAYYSLEGAGADVWRLILAGASTDEAVEALSRGYRARRDEVATAVAGLIARLREEGLVEPTPAGTVAAAGVELKPTRPFEPPVLRKYTDMQDLLLVDPIHEVDDAGWPRKRGEG